jgi:putative N6-adenine-specific DNA methylase
MADDLALFAVSAPGLELIVASELGDLGCAGTVVEGGVEWPGTVEHVRRANLWLRTATRVLVRIASFRARTFFELERYAAGVPWSTYVTRGRPVVLRVSARKSKLYHERAIAERLLRSMGAPPTNVGEEDEGESEGERAQLFVVRVWRDRFTISVDSSGALLHRRGYREALGRAPLRETLAAALLRAANWTAGEPLLDPFCGSGTIAIEAALLARGIAPGLARATREARGFAFEHWPQHDARAWQEEIAQARAQMRAETGVLIMASDRDAGAIRSARQNAQRAGVENQIQWTVAPLSSAPAPAGKGLLVTNPPYGSRVSATTDLRDLYAALGHYKRERLPDWRVALLSADARLSAQIQLSWMTVAETNNGGIPVRLLVSTGE